MTTATHSPHPGQKAITMTLNRNGLTAIVPLLTQQHRQVAALLDAVERTAGHDRLLAFNELRRYPERVRLDRATPRPPTRPEVLLPR